MQKWQNNYSKNSKHLYKLKYQLTGFCSHKKTFFFSPYAQVYTLCVCVFGFVHVFVCVHSQWTSSTSVACCGVCVRATWSTLQVQATPSSFLSTCSCRELRTVNVFPLAFTSLAPLKTVAHCHRSRTLILPGVMATHKHEAPLCLNSSVKACFTNTN